MRRQNRCLNLTIISFWLGLIIVGGSAAVMAANPQVAVYQDTTIDSASDFNWSISYFHDLPNSNLPWPANRIAQADGNIAYVSLSADPGHAAVAQAGIGVLYDWDLGSFSWDQVTARKVSVTVNFTYEISADYADGNGSTFAAMSFSIPEFNKMEIYGVPNYDAIGYEGTSGNHGGTYSLTLDTTIGEMPTHIDGLINCMSDSVNTAVYNSYSKLTINSITFHPDHDYSKYEFNYYYNDDSGDYYTGFVYAPTSFTITNDADNHGFIQVGTHLTNEPAEMGGGALGGFYNITSITDGYDSSYDKKEHITSYYDADTSKPSYTLYTNREQGKAGNESKPVELIVSDRTKAHESGYVYDPLVPDDDAYFGNADVCYDFDPTSSTGNNFLVAYIADLPYWNQPQTKPGSCSEVAGAIVLSFWDNTYPGLIVDDWKNNWPDCSTNYQNSPTEYVNLIGTLAQDMHWHDINNWFNNLFGISGTSGKDIGPGLETYARDQGYAVASLINNWQGFGSVYYDVTNNWSSSWIHYEYALYSQKRPVIVDVEWYYQDSNGDYKLGGHSTVGRGYWNDGYVCLNFGWGTNDTNKKIDWDWTTPGTSETSAMVTSMVDFYW